MKKHALEITLHSIQIPVPGVSLKKKSTHLLTATLIWPRLGVPKKASTQSVALEKGSADFDTINWGKKILFRENLEGRCALALTITENLEFEELEKFLRFWAKTLLGITSHAVDAAVGPLGDLAAAPIDYASKVVAKYPGAALLADGMVELDADEFPPPGSSRLITVRMTAARRLVRATKHRATAKLPARTTNKVLLKQGDDNGEITLHITSL